MKINVKECISCSLLGISECDILEIDRSVRNFHDGLGGIRDRRFLVQHFNDTLSRLNGHRKHYVDHRYHHERHEDLESVCHESGDLTDVHRGALACYSHLGTYVKNKDNVKVQAKFHQR